MAAKMKMLQLEVPKSVHNRLDEVNERRYKPTTKKKLAYEALLIGLSALETAVENAEELCNDGD